MDDVVTRFEDVHEKENAYVTRHVIQENSVEITTKRCIVCIINVVVMFYTSIVSTHAVALLNDTNANGIFSSKIFVWRTNQFKYQITFMWCQNLLNNSDSGFFSEALCFDESNYSRSVAFFKQIMLLFFWFK